MKNKMFVVLWGLCAATGWSQLVQLSQVSLHVDSGTYLYSDWGSVDVTFVDPGSIQYFNLSVNGSWQVQNIPVFSLGGGGSSQTNTFDFKIGPGGSPLGPVSFGFSFSSAPTLQPFETLSATPTVREVVMSSDEGFVPITYVPAVPLVGGLALATAAAQAGFPNQDVGLNECVPGAISNSLMYLNNRYGLGMPAASISLEKLKTVLGTTAAGTPLGWWDKKAAYMKDSGLPITTTVVTDIKVAMDQLQSGQDVELGGGGHRAAVVKIVDLGGGRYAIDVSHDTEQDKVGGTKVETTIYDSATGDLTGAFGFDGAKFRNFVIECPIPEPSTALMIGLFGLSIVAVRLSTMIKKARAS